MRALKVVPEPYEGWEADRSCVGVHPNTFYRHTDTQKDWKRYCDRCPVRLECLAAALYGREHYGIWGGMNEHERERISRRLGRGRFGWADVPDLWPDWNPDDGTETERPTPSLLSAV